MSSMRIQFSPDAQAKIDKMVQEYMENTVLPKITEAAKRIAPIDTGELQGSIHYTSADGRYYVGADAEHASFVEQGTSKMAAQPFLRPAMTTAL